MAVTIMILTGGVIGAVKKTGNIICTISRCIIIKLFSPDVFLLHELGRITRIFYYTDVADYTDLLLHKMTTITESYQLHTADRQPLTSH